VGRIEIIQHLLTILGTTERHARQSPVYTRFITIMEALVATVILESHKLVRKFVQRAEDEHGIPRKAIAADLDVSGPAISNWTGSGKAISPHMVAKFGKAARLTACEVYELFLLRLKEEDGQNPQLDYGTLEEIFKLFLPTRTEQALLDAFHRAQGDIPLHFHISPGSAEQLVLLRALKKAVAEIRDAYLEEAKAV
jgi:hypothetical protein